MANPIQLPTLPPSPLHLQVQRQDSNPLAIVRWGSKEFRLELIQTSSQGEETVIPLSDQELRDMIPKIEQALVKMQRANLDPAQLSQVDLRWKAMREGDKIVAYTYEETSYMRNQEQVRQKIPLIINGEIERSFPELKSLDEFFSRKLLPTTLSN